MEKRCSKCGEVKSAEDFHKKRVAKDGLNAYCKPCNKRNRAEWGKKNREKVLVIQRRFRERHPGVSSAWYHADENNKDLTIKRSKLWQQENPDKATACNHVTRSKRFGASGRFTGQEWADLKARYDYRCLRCGQKKKLTVDHIVPLELGGSNDISNIQPLCRRCNGSKGLDATDYRT